MVTEQYLELWKQMTSGNCFRYLLDKGGAPVLVLGLMGAGKSTVIGIQQGAKYEAFKELADGRWKRVYKCVQADARTPQTSDGYTSKTLNIGVYVAGKQHGGYTFLDTAGMNENRTEEHRQWTQWNLATLLSIIPSIKCIIVVIDYRSLVSERGSSLRQLAKSLSCIVGVGENSRPFYDSMVFVFTHAYEDGEKATAEGVLGVAEKQRQELEKQLTKFAQSAAAAQPKQEAEADKLAVYTFLKTLASAKGRIHMSFPDSARQSAKQMEAVRTLIDNSPGIPRTGLKALAASKPTNSVHVLQMLAALVTQPYKKLGSRSYTEIIRQRADKLEQLQSQFKTHEDRVTAIQSDWQAVQRDLVDSLSRSLDELEVQKREVEGEKDEKQISEKWVVICTREVKQSRPTSGWWILCMFGGGWGWGKHSAEYTLCYSDEWFSKYTVHGPDHDYNVQEESPRSGSLKIHFKSHAGTDLNAEVKFYRAEKDTEETKRRIQSLERRIEELSAQIAEKENEKTLLRTAQSDKDLLQRLMKGKESIELEDQEISRQLGQDAVQPSDDFPNVPSEWGVLYNIAGILSVLIEQNMLPSDLASSTSNPIHEFLKEFKRLGQVLKNLGHLQDQGFVSLQQAHSGVAPTEDAPPVAPTLQARASSCLNALSQLPVVEAANPLIQYAAGRKQAIACALFIYGFLLKFWPSADLQGAFGNIFMACAAFCIFAKVFEDGAHSAGMVGSSCSRMLEKVLRVTDLRLRGTSDQLMATLTGCSSDIKEALQNMQSFVKVF